ncbi:MAG: AAA family ATPase [Candidatus Brocadiaceae bacterium]|nr:AAA family ATPase [Candidatus Brocadiaceae bacterium]
MADSLDYLTIRGFKSIQTLEKFELKKLNVLIGGNGAGKSNLIGFFRLLRKIIDGNLNEYIRSSGGVSDVLFNGRKVTPQIEFETRFGVRGYRFNIKPGPLENCLLTDESRYYKRGSTGWWVLGDSPDGNSLLVKEAKNTSSSNSKYSQPVYEAIASWQIYHFHDTSATAAMRHYEIIQDNKVLRFNASNIAPYLLQLRNKQTDAYREILNAVRLVMPFFDDFLLDVTEFGEKQKVNLSWRQKGLDYPMQPYHFSDGSIRFVCLATAMLQPNPPSTIIIDEPELGLHPSAIPILAELVQNASNRTQLIVATQSPALIDNFNVEDVVVVNRKDGASTFERLQEEDFNIWLETYSVGELWSKNVISGGPVYE